MCGQTHACKWRPEQAQQAQQVRLTPRQTFLCVLISWFEPWPFWLIAPAAMATGGAGAVCEKLGMGPGCGRLHRARCEH